MTTPALDPVKLDLEQMRRNLLRQGQPSRVHYFEHGIGAGVKDEIVRRFDLERALAGPRGVDAWYWQREIALHRFLGFELFRVWLPGGEFAVAGSLGTTWGQEHAGPIRTWDDLEEYRWPDLAAIDYGQLEFYERQLPADMGVFHTIKIWEVVRELLGFGGFCTQMYEDPTLVAEVVRRVGEFHLALCRALCDFRCVFAIYGADDYAYKTSTMMDPHYIVGHFLPWHRRMAAMAHGHGKLFFFHCCGKIDPLMDYLIDEVKIDAKHSFEDTIVPVTDAKGRCGDRVALLGGLDVDFVARSEQTAIASRVRETLDVCQPGGGYCLGMGNWGTDYIPVENYLTVMAAGRRWGR